jgi:hypothetical protein
MAHTENVYQIVVILTQRIVFLLEFGCRDRKYGRLILL